MATTPPSPALAGPNFVIYLFIYFKSLQILELPVSERDIEKEHLAQLRRWKEAHGELHCTSPPRMHGARAIMAAEPPSRQDLQQKPTIIVEPAQINSSGGDERKKEEKKKREADKNKDKDSSLHTVNQDQVLQDQALPSQSQVLLKDTNLQASNQSLSSTEHDTYL